MRAMIPFRAIFRQLDVIPHGQKLAVFCRLCCFAIKILQSLKSPALTSEKSQAVAAATWHASRHSLSCPATSENQERGFFSIVSTKEAQGSPAASSSASPTGDQYREQASCVKDGVGRMGGSVDC